MKIYLVITVLFLNRFTHGAISGIMDRCCMTGSDWAKEQNQRCDSYPTAVAGVEMGDQRSCRSILEVCCMKEKQKIQCDRGHTDALEYPVCATRNVFGAEQYLECCHCCHLGKAHGDMGGDCNYLTDVAFGGPCDRKFKECCLGNSGLGGGSGNETGSDPDLENDLDECELHPGVLCSHKCINTVGSYRCECNPGHTLHTDGSTCIESDSGINCALYNPCQQRCVDGRTGVECQCNPGYTLDGDGVSCSDINECVLGTSNCPESTLCLNTEGGFMCEPIPDPQECQEGTEYDPETDSCQPIQTCDAGYGFNTITRSCDDLDECTAFLHNCYAVHMLCVNTPGSFTCRCDDGFMYDNRTMICQDIDECARNIDTCLSTQRCENTIGSFTCRRILGCGTGYTMDSETQTCVDRDECATGTHNCGTGYSCINIQGSFRCVPKQCQRGYRFSSASGRCEPINCPRGLRPNRRGSCTDIDECDRSRPRVCRRTESCINTYGSYRCTSIYNCQAGFEADMDTNGCVDIDECSRGTHDCKKDQRCINRPGSFICDCPRGYRVNRDGDCEDVDECVDSFRCPFDSHCQNTPGSYTCGCNEGLRSEGNRCVDINECEDPNMCQYRCINVYGSFHCQCRTGYTLGSDKRSCEDIDECSQFGGDNLCGGNCRNTPGSYTCDCPDGWTSYGRGQACRDIDECRQRPEICGQDNICFNTKGSYKCPNIVCPPGFVKSTLGPRRNSVRCRRVQFQCPENDIECQNAPISLSFNFLSFPTNVRVPADLFAMSGPQSRDKRFSWELEVVDVEPLRDDVNSVNRGYFNLDTNNNEAIVRLLYAVPGPQDIELKLTMNINSRRTNVFLGKAVSKIYLYITDRDIFMG